MLCLVVMSKTNNYDLNLLTVFRLLMEVGSVSKVAVRIGITQSALSHALNKLRIQFDDPLFTKTSQGMQPTLRATEIYHAVKEPLERLTDALQQTQEFDAKTSQHTFILGTSDYFEKLFLTKIIHYFTRHAPKVKLQCITCNEQDLTKELREVDFIFGRFARPPENLYKKTLWQDSFVTLVNKNHPRIKQGEISLAQFIEEKHVLISPTGTGSSFVDRELTKLGLKRNVTVTSRLFSTPIEIVQSSDMITTMPRRLASHCTDLNKVKLINTPLSLADFEMNMLWGPVKHQEPAHQWFRKTIVAIAEQS